MASERDLELLDDYLANRMPAESRASFEKNIDSNVELKNELNLQKQLIVSIQKARAAELKAVLNNISVSAISTGSSVATKVAAWTGVSVFVGAVLYFIVFDKEIIKTEKPTEIVRNENTENSTAHINPKEQPTTVPVEKEEIVYSPKQNTETKKTNRKTKEVTAVEPKIEVFDPSTELEETSSKPDEEITLSDNKSTAVSKSAITVVIDSNNRKFDFHYKLENDQLTLYGEFEKNLYEILEFISEEKQTVFLYHKQSYYVLKQTAKVTNLIPVKDPVLLKKLREHRTGTK